VFPGSAFLLQAERLGVAAATGSATAQHG